MRLPHIALIALTFIITNTKSDTTPPNQSIIIQTNIKTTTEDGENTNTVKNHTVQKPSNFIINSRLATEAYSTEHTKIDKKEDKSATK